VPCCCGHHRQLSVRRSRGCRDARRTHEVRQARVAGPFAQFRDEFGGRFARQREAFDGALLQEHAAAGIGVQQQAAIAVAWLQIDEARLEACGQILGECRRGEAQADEQKGCGLRCHVGFRKMYASMFAAAPAPRMPPKSP